MRANTTPHSASWACDVKILVPFSTQPPSFFTAVVWMAPAGSDPPLGSVIAKKVLNPSRMAGMAYFSICSAVPAKMNGAGGRPKTPQPGL